MLSVPYEPYFRIGNVLRGKHLGRLGNHPEHVQHWNLRTFETFLAGSVAEVRIVGSVSLDHRLLPSKPTLIFLLLTAIGVARIASTYRAVAQTSDETPNIACGMQYLDLGRYDYGAFHPPLARLAMAVGPYLYGARVAEAARPLAGRQRGAEQRAALRQGADAGAARHSAVLPAGLHRGVAVGPASCWASGAALAPVFVFTNTAAGAGACRPGHHGYGDRRRDRDGAVTRTRCGWSRDSLRRSVFFGIGIALAMLSKFSSVLLLPVCIAGDHAAVSAGARQKRNWAWIAVAFVLIWGAYRFSFGPMTEHVARDAAEQGGIFAKIPTRAAARCWRRVPVPAPQILDGLWQVHNHVDAGHTAYLLGQHSFHGWWYFFPVALAVKTPLAMLLLALVRRDSRCAARSGARCGCRRCCAAVILLVNLPTSLNIGVRYMLPLYPLLALTAGIGVVWLWPRQRCGRGRCCWCGLAISSGGGASRLSRLLQRTRAARIPSASWWIPTWIGART